MQDHSTSLIEPRAAILDAERQFTPPPKKPRWPLMIFLCLASTAFLAIVMSLSLALIYDDPTATNPVPDTTIIDIFDGQSPNDQSSDNFLDSDALEPAPPTSPEAPAEP